MTKKADKKDNPLQREIRGWLGEHGNVVESDDRGTQLNVLSSEEFANTDYRREFLVKHILVRGQPGIVGALRKGLKTSVMCDLALSMASGKPFLNDPRFSVPRRLCVGFLSGESGEAAIQDTALRICAAKKISLAATRLMWGFTLPKLSDPTEMDALREIIEEYRLEVIIIDPVYLCLLTGNPTVQAASMFDMGPLLASVSELCLNAGCTPVLVHHFRKPSTYRNNKQSGSKEADPPDLDELAFSGFGEYARQWLLLGRRKPFDPETGHHALWLIVGGSAGFTGMYGLDVTEGKMDEHFKGRRWEPHVSSGLELIEAKEEEKENRRDKGAQATKARRRGRLLEALKQFPEGRAVSPLAKLASMDTAVAEVLLAELIEEGHAERCEIVCASGPSQRTISGFRRARIVVDDEDESEETKKTEVEDD